MKPIIYTEVEFKNKKLFTNNFSIKDENKYYYYNSSERITKDGDLQNIVFEIYKILLNEYSDLGKIKSISISFIDNNDILICSFIFRKVKKNKNKKIETIVMKSCVIDWKNIDTQLKFIEIEGDKNNESFK